MQDVFGIDDLEGGRVVAFLKLDGWYGVETKEFDSLQLAYGTIQEKIRDIPEFLRISDIYEHRKEGVLSPLIGNRDDWATLFGRPADVTVKRFSS
jgi:hypothetical protein